MSVWVVADDAEGTADADGAIEGVGAVDGAAAEAVALAGSEGATLDDGLPEPWVGPHAPTTIETDTAMSRGARRRRRADRMERRIDVNTSVSLGGIDDEACRTEVDPGSGHLRRGPDRAIGRPCPQHVGHRS